jgi:hypothetical protein
MSFFEEDYELPVVKLTLKTKEGYSNNPKAPALRGFLAVNRQSLKDIEQHIDASDKDSVFLSVVLWAARDAKYVHEGFVELKAVAASADDDTPLKGKVTQGVLPPLEATARAVPKPTVEISGLPF